MPPPVPLQADDLAGLHTKRGARLGISPADIVRLYGPAREYDVKQRLGMTMLSYTSRRLVENHNEECGNDENFTFRHGRLIAI